MAKFSNIIPLTNINKYRDPTTPIKLYNKIGLGSSPFARHY